MAQLHRYLYKIRGWVKLRDTWNLAQASLWFACIVCVGIQFLGFVVPIENLWFWSLIPLLLWLLVLSWNYFLDRQSLFEIARHVDIELALMERMSTAVALERMPSEAKGSFPQRLILAQQRDALQIAQQISRQKNFPLLVNRRQLAIAGFLTILFIITQILPNPMDEILAQRRHIQNAAAAQADVIDQIKEDIEQSQELSSETRDEIARELAELAEKLRSNPDDLEQILSDYNQVEQFLTPKIDPASAAQAANLRSLAANLQSMTGLEVESDQNLSEIIDQALKQLGDQANIMSEMERQQLAQQLAQMAAQTAQGGDMQLAQSLAQLAQAIQSGNQEAIQQAVTNASNAASQSQQRMDTQAKLTQTLSALQTSQQAMSMAGQQTAQSQGTTPGQGQSPGQGQGNPGGSGGGTKDSSLPPAVGQGSPSRPQGSKPGTTSSDPIQNIYVPREQGISNGDELFIPGQDSGQGDTQVSEGQTPLPGVTSPVLVPYSQVYYDYLSAAYQAMQQAYIPAYLLAYIQMYFTQLEP